MCLGAAIFYWGTIEDSEGTYYGHTTIHTCSTKVFLCLAGFNLRSMLGGGKTGSVGLGSFEQVESEHFQRDFNSPRTASWRYWHVKTATSSAFTCIVRWAG